MATFCLVIECPLLFLQFKSFLKSYIPYISSLMFLDILSECPLSLIGKKHYCFVVAGKLLLLSSS